MPTSLSVVVIHDPSLWVAVFSAAASIASAVFAWATWYTSRDALRLAEQKDQRHHPTLVPYLADGLCKYIEGDRLLAFSVSLSNPSDSDNAVSILELQVEYETEKGALMAVKIPSQSDLALRFGNEKLKSLVPPLPIGAHQTVAGWAMFELSDTVIGQSSIKSYTVLFVDAHGNVTRLENTFVREVVIRPQ